MKSSGTSDMTKTARIGFVIAALLAVSSAPLAWAEDAKAPSGARATVDAFVAKVFAVLQNEELSLDEKRIGIENIAYERFDFYTFSRLVLAKNWKLFTPGQQKEFQSEFKVYLAQEYGRRLDDYENEKVEVKGEKPEIRGDVTVKTRIVGGKFNDAAVNYRMREKDGEWYIIDVVIEGISLVSNWRDQFRSVLRGKDGPQKLLAKLQAKNHERKEELSAKAH